MIHRILRKVSTDSSFRYASTKTVLVSCLGAYTSDWELVVKLKKNLWLCITGTQMRKDAYSIMW